VVPWLRGLGFRVEEARKAAALCDDMPNAPIEQRVRLALTYFSKSPRRTTPGAGTHPLCDDPACTIHSGRFANCRSATSSITTT
jgi:hypothetical protein